MNLLNERVSHAAWLPAVSRPPHDPRRLPLNHRSGWHVAKAVNVSLDSCGYLSLALKPRARRRLAEASGSLGGLQLPGNMAYTGDCGLILLDPVTAMLKKFDPCSCNFLTIPHTGGQGAGPRQFADPQGIAICGDNLLVADTGNNRLSVYSLLGFLLRGFWQPPAAAGEQIWQPVAVQLSLDRKVLVADPANGCVHVFNFAGCWLRCIEGVGAVEKIAIDKLNRLYVMAGEDQPVVVYDLPSGDRLHQLSDEEGFESDGTEKVEQYFSPAAVEIDASGAVNLGPLCAWYQNGDPDHAKPAWFSSAGIPIAAPEKLVSKYQQQGVIYTTALDSHLYRCQWDRLVMQLAVPRGSRVKVSSFTAEAELTCAQILNLDEDQWLTRQWVFPNSDSDLSWDCLLRSEPGRLLWLKIEFAGDGMSTPQLCNVELNFPRISLSRHLPAVFSEEPNAADFTDRFVEIFDHGFRQIETRIDFMAQLFDPLSAPASAGKRDFLSWLASWIGITADRQLPLPLRRKLVKNTGKLFRCRGTVNGLRNMLDLYLGFSDRTCVAADKNSIESCGPCTTRPSYSWQPPRVILEHFILRRWLYLGFGRLGDQARLWGAKIVNRSQLNGPQVDGNAQLGVTRLNTRQDPLRDPFHEYAHKFTIFLPAWVGRLNHFRTSISRLIEAEKPAHSQHSIIYVEPRFRVGIQSMIGFDSVIGCYPQGITLNQSRLGKASVLSAQDNSDSTLRIGSKSTIGTTTRLK